MRKIFILSLAAFVAFACSKDESSTPKSSEKKILKFSVNAYDGIINETTRNIVLTLPAGSDLTEQTPVIEVSEKAKVSPASGVKQNFTQPVAYTVTAEDGTTAVYVVSMPVTRRTDAQITSFLFAGLNPKISADINEVTKTIMVEFPLGTDVSALVPTIDISAGASINPPSGTAQDFSTPVTYTVTPEEGAPVTYVVTVTVLKTLRDGMQITTFSFPNLNPAVTATINEETKVIEAFVPNGTNVTNLAPTISVSPGASVSPESGVVQNFTSPVQYIVTAENGHTTTYTVAVTVTVGLGTGARILAFSFPGLTPVITASIDEVTKTITATVPYGTNITSLIPAIAISDGAGINPPSAVAADFTSPLQYIVTSENGANIVPYTVTVQVAPFGLSITNITPLSVAPGGTITITGNFAESGNVVRLYNATIPMFLLNIISESATAIVAQVPSTATEDDYTLQLTAHGVTKEYTSLVKVYDPTLPHLLSLNKTSLIKGFDDLIITGDNLGTAGKLYFERKEGGTTYFTIYPVIPQDGTMITIIGYNLADMVLNDYDIYYEVTATSIRTNRLRVSIVENTLQGPTILGIEGNNYSPCRGSVVTITGSNFAANAEVWLGIKGEPGTYYHYSSSDITITSNEIKFIMNIPIAVVINPIMVISNGKSAILEHDLQAVICP